MLRHALIHVDIQNDFCLGGALAVKDGDKVVKPANCMTLHAQSRGWQIVFTRDWHKADSPHFKTWPRHCIQNTEGAKFHPRLFVPSDAYTLFKGMDDSDGYDPFEKEAKIFTLVLSEEIFLRRSNYTLESLLRAKGVGENFIDGLATDYCVKAAAISSVRLGFKTYLLRDACRAVNLKPKDEQKAINEMKKAGVIITSTEKVIRST